MLVEAKQGRTHRSRQRTTHRLQDSPVCADRAASAEEEAEEHRLQVEDELQLPVADIFRDGPERIIDAVQQARQDWLAGDGSE